MGEEPQIAVVGTKGQIVIPQQLREDLHITPKTKLLLYRKGDKIVIAKLNIPPLEDLTKFIKEIDERREDNRRLTEREILAEIQAYRRENRKT
jgi:AbrB family looped-hinge helix DNA binding protein